MKKKLVASLAAAMVLGVAGTSFAASNPFTDVPAKHWAYGSVTKLAQAGIVDGYGDGTYLGDKMMSRYEMAQITAKAMAHSDKADASQKAMIDQLSVEFASELEGLNVRVTKIEKNASSVKVTGYSRIRFQDTTDKQTAGVAKQADKNLVLRTRLFVNGNINDQWAYAGRLENNQNFYTAAGDNTTDLNMAYVTGPVAGATATVGRFDLTPIYGNLMDDALDGVKFAFGNQVKTNVYYGKVSDASTNTANTSFSKATADKDITLTGADVKYATSKATNLVGGWTEYKAKQLNLKRNIWELGFDSKIAKNVVVNGEYLKSNDSTANKALFAGVTYKAANVKNVGSFSTWVNYRYFQSNVAVDGLSVLDNALLPANNDGKGYEVGFNYVPMTNAKLTFKYVDTKGVSNTSDKAKFYRAQAEFWF